MSPDTRELSPDGPMPQQGDLSTGNTTPTREFSNCMSAVCSARVRGQQPCWRRYLPAKKYGPWLACRAAIGNQLDRVIAGGHGAKNQLRHCTACAHDRNVHAPIAWIQGVHGIELHASVSAPASQRAPISTYPSPTVTPARQSDRHPACEFICSRLHICWAYLGMISAVGVVAP
jgi:hypothetical protein